MFPIAVARLSRPAATRLSIQNAAAARRYPINVATVRFNSSQPKTQSLDKQAKREDLERLNDLLRDWDARILTYDELKPKTQSPTQCVENPWASSSLINVCIRIHISLMSARGTKLSKA